MKTAIVLRGLSRHYQKSIPIYRRLYPDADFYFHTWDIDGKRTDAEQRASYSLQPIDIAAITDFIKPVHFEVENYEKFIQDITPMALYFLQNFNISYDKIAPHFPYLLNTMFCQMWSIQEAVKLVTYSGRAGKYDRIAIVRFDLKLHSKLILPKSGEVITSAERWHGIPRDFIHVISPNNLDCFTSMYNELYSIPSWDIIQNKHQRFPVPNAETWLNYYLKTKKLRFLNKLNVSLIR